MELLAQPTGLSSTASVGSLTVEEGLGLTGQSFSASVGSISLRYSGWINWSISNI